MKLSKYNIISSNRGGHFVYNTFSGGLIQLDEEHACFLSHNKLEYLSVEEMDLLQANGIVVPDDCDEYAMITHMFRSSRYNHNDLAITIVPTYECNFACPYCYERDLRGRYDKYTWDAVVDYLKTVEGNYKVISLTFYGGEPLLEQNEIFRFLDKVKSDHIQLYHKLHLSMVTNGYLLTKNVVDRFKEHNLQGVQITIDGNQNQHNERRPHKINRDSYQRIIENIKYAVQSFSINIRMNLDKNNSNTDIQRLMNELDIPDGHPNLTIYSGRLIVEEEKEMFHGYSPVEFSKCHLEQYHKAMNANAQYYSLSELKLEPTETVCMADLCDSLVILPDGNITNCWNNLSSDEEISRNHIGAIQNGKLILYPYKIANWLEQNDISNFKSECKECMFLPVCLGGCPKARHIIEPNCCYSKFWTDAYIDAATIGALAAYEKKLSHNAR